MDPYVSLHCVFVFGKLLCLEGMVRLLPMLLPMLTYWGAM